MCFFIQRVTLVALMEKTQYDKETSRILTEAIKLKEKARLDLDTAIFFEEEEKKLENILDDSDSTEDQVDDALVKLVGLNARIQVELRDTDDEALRIERELLVLNNKAIMEGLI